MSWSRYDRAAAPPHMLVLNPILSDLAANYSGRVWIYIVNFACIPLYFRYLGAEAYGLVGFFSTLQSVFAIIDFGLGTGVTREVARLSAIPNSAQETRDCFRSLEAVYWAIALCVGLASLPCGKAIARRWIHASTLAPGVTETSIGLMGATLAVGWLGSMYGAGLLGLQRHGIYNLLNTALVTMRNLGAVAVLKFGAGSALAFFRWQLGATAVLAGAMAIMLRRSLPGRHLKSHVSIRLIGAKRGSLLGLMTAYCALVLFNQTDKLLFSKLLRLDVYGQLTLAWQIGSCFYLFYNPVATALFPRFSQLLAGGDAASLERLYRRGCLAVSAGVVPAATVLALFSGEVLTLWLGRGAPATAAQHFTAMVIPFAAVGALIHLPTMLQWAAGWTRPSVITNLVAAAVLVPLLPPACRYFGAEAAIAVWGTVRSVQAVAQMEILHRRLLPKARSTFYWQSVLRPAAAAIAVALICRLLLPANMGAVRTLFALALVWVTTAVWSAAASGALPALISLARAWGART